MFNPQRRSKVSDILMQQKAFQLHLTKVHKIRQSYSHTQRRNQDELEQQTYRQRLDIRRKQVKDRKSNDIKKENRRLLYKLNATDARPEENPEHQIPQKHFNSYFNSIRESSRIRADNLGMMSRMVSQGSVIPTLSAMKKDFKQNKRYAKMVRKLPSILKHQEEFKRQLSTQRLSGSQVSLRSGTSARSKNESRDKELNARSATQDIRQIEARLIVGGGP